MNVIRALLFVFEKYEDQLRKLLGLLMLREMVHTLNWNELFRANSATTAVRRTLFCIEGVRLEVVLEDADVESVLRLLCSCCGNIRANLAVNSYSSHWVTSLTNCGLNQKNTK